jgi:DNA-binding IscR family transcriptional regulator
MENTKNSKEKIAIRYIMRQVNKAYTDYIDAISVDEETRRENMKNINMKMAA